MKRYRLYTEDVNHERTQFLIKESFPCCTIYKSLGIYNGKVENSIVIEVVTDDKSTRSLLQALAVTIKQENKQATLLLTVDELESSYL